MFATKARVSVRKSLPSELPPELPPERPPELLGLFSFGRNEFSQLGLGESVAGDYFPSPVQIGESTDWKQIACGENFTLAIKQDGTLWGWGSTTSNALGVGYGVEAYFPYPVQIGTDDDWEYISCTRNTSAAIKKNGTLWTPDPDTGFYRQVTEYSDWSTVSCGDNFRAAIRKGKLYTWGYNGVNQCGQGYGKPYIVTDPTQITEFEDWEQVQCGNSHSIAIRAGKLYAWGDDSCWQTGLLNPNGGGNQNVPAEITEFEDFGGEWTKIAAGDYRNIALKGNTLYTWGNKRSAQNQTYLLGLGKVEPLRGLQVLDTLPEGIDDWDDISISVSHTALIRNGELYVWGMNEYGELGLGDTVDRYTPVKVGLHNNWKQVSCGLYYTIALRDVR